MAVENLAELAIARWGEEGADFALVHFSQNAQSIERAFFFRTDGFFAHGEKLLGGLAHCGNHQDGFSGQCSPDDSCDAFHGGRRLERRAAEFHYDHAAITMKTPLLRTADPSFALQRAQE